MTVKREMTTTRQVGRWFTDPIRCLQLIESRLNLELCFHRPPPEIGLGVVTLSVAYFSFKEVSLSLPKRWVLRSLIKYGISNPNIHASLTSVQMIDHGFTFPDLWSLNFNVWLTLYRTGFLLSKALTARIWLQKLRPLMKKKSIVFHKC